MKTGRKRSRHIRFRVGRCSPEKPALRPINKAHVIKPTALRRLELSQIKTAFEERRQIPCKSPQRYCWLIYNITLVKGIINKAFAYYRIVSVLWCCVLWVLYIFHLYENLWLVARVYFNVWWRRCLQCLLEIFYYYNFPRIITFVCIKHLCSRAARNCSNNLSILSLNI